MRIKLKKSIKQITEMSKIAAEDLIHVCHHHLQFDILKLAVREGKEILLIPLPKHLVQVDPPPVDSIRGSPF